MKKRMDSMKAKMTKVPKFKSMGGGIGPKSDECLDPIDITACPEDKGKKSHNIKKKITSKKK